MVNVKIKLDNLDFQALLKLYLDSHPGSERKLADEFRTSVGTITRWVNGHSRPAKKAQEAIRQALKDKIYNSVREEFQNFLNANLNDEVALELAREFEVATSTVKRWAKGTARPHLHLALMVIDYVQKIKTHIPEMFDTEKDKKPPYPWLEACRGCTEPEWEWEGFEDVWTCLGCGMAIIGKTGEDAFAPKKSSKKAKKQKAKINQTTTLSQEERIQCLKNLKPGDKFAYKNVGYGLVTYENGSDALEIKNGKLFTDTFSSMGMEWTGQTWKFDSGLGLVTSIVLLEDVPKGQLAD